MHTFFIEIFLKTKVHDGDSFLLHKSTPTNHYLWLREIHPVKESNKKIKMNPNFHKTQIRQIDAKKLGILLLPCSNSNILLSEATIFDEMVEEEEEREQS